MKGYDILGRSAARQNGAAARAPFRSWSTKGDFRHKGENSPRHLTSVVKSMPRMRNDKGHHTILSVCAVRLLPLKPAIEDWRPSSVSDLISMPD